MRNVVRKSSCYSFLQHLVVGASIMLAPFMATAEGKYPFDPVSLIVPYPAGGVGDTTGRIFADSIGKALGANIIVQNIGGASGSIGANKVLNSPADGAIVFQGSQNELILAPMFNDAIRYKPSDFESLQPVTVTPLVLIVRADLPVQSVDDFVALAKKRSSGVPLTYGTTGQGSLYHLVTERVAKAANVTFTHVPYRGAAPLIQDLIGGQIDFTITAYQTSMKALADQGRFKLIAGFSKEKAKSLANLPSISETPVFSDIDYASYVGYFVKKGTPAEVSQKLNRAIGKALQDPTVIEKIEVDGRSVVKPGSLEDARAAYEHEVSKYADIKKATGIVLN